MGNVVNDAAGFFLQAEQEGPALFVEVDPLTLSPAPQAGARVRVTVSEKSLVNGQVRARISAYAVLSTGHSLSDLVQDVSGVDGPIPCSASVPRTRTRGMTGSWAAPRSASGTRRPVRAGGNDNRRLVPGAHPRAGRRFVFLASV
ncbi:hypothetical protein [Myxococcus xanthus]|uniref:hypothetical protein n=1 Tax=Myxococcus xanthus TaxID=34 RepID=UPI001C1281F0|nr:hypothetical protein [Myxococcus xanthus]